MTHPIPPDRAQAQPARTGTAPTVPGSPASPESPSRAAAGITPGASQRPPAGDAPGVLPHWPAHPQPEDIRVNVTLPVAPMAKGRPRVSPAEYTRIGTMVIKTRAAHGWTPAATRRYEERLGWELRRARVRHTGGVPLGVHAVFHVAQDSAAGDTVPDLDNLLKALLDAGNSITWADDAQVKRISGAVIEASPEPRVEFAVYILREVAR